MSLWRTLLGIGVLALTPAAWAEASNPIGNGLFSPVAACGSCDGKVSQLTLRYLGPVRNADVQVFQRNQGDQLFVFRGVVQPGASFTIAGKDNKETLGPQIRILVNGVENARIQTSCETPIGPGLVAGDFAVVQGESRNGGALCRLAPPPPGPSLRATRTTVLHVDADGSLGVSPGDTLRATAVVTNPGPRRVGNAVYHEAPDPALALTAGSVATTQGTVAGGNAPADTLVTVDLGSLAPGASATVTFELTVRSSAAGADLLASQGFASGDGVPGVPSDDPATPQAGDATLTPLGARPLLDAVQSASLRVDADGSEGVSPGDTLLYTVIVRNGGTAPSTGITFAEIPGPHLRLVSGSVTASQGAVVAGNSTGDSSVAVGVGGLPPGGSATITFEAVLEDTLPDGTGFVSSQGLVTSSENSAGEVTDDPATLADDDPTRTPLQGGGPLLSAAKLDVLLVDLDGDGRAGAGDLLRYVVILTNHGGEDATGVVFGDVPDASTILAVGTAAASPGEVAAGNAAGHTDVEVEIGTLAAGESAAVAFVVAVADPLPAGAASVANQGSAASDGRPALLTDDPSTPLAGDPTLTPLATTAALGDFAWHDLDGDGLQDAGEPGLAGVTVRLLDAAGHLLEAATTGAGGSYLFEDLQPGGYIVEFVAPAGYVFSLKDQGTGDAKDSDADPATGRTGVVTLGRQDDLTVDAGLTVRPQNGLGDFVWEDLDGDGVQDAEEPGIAGVVVRLLDAAGAQLATTVTGLDGFYAFEELGHGSYFIEFSAPPDFRFSPKDRGSDETLDSDADPMTGRTAALSMPAPESSGNVDAGLYRPAAVAGFLWDDGNGNGLQEPTERGLPQASAELLDAAGQIVATTSTDAGGSYRFGNLSPGEHSVRFALPSGFAFSPPNQGGDDALDSDVDPATGRAPAFVLHPGDRAVGPDAGFFQPVTLISSSPASGESGVALSRETIFRLSSALSESAVVDASHLFAEFGGNRLASRIHVSPDRRTITLFYDQILPASARVRVTLVGDGLTNEFGNDMDADGDGQPGGVARVDFDTLSLTTLPGTRVCGRVFASELAPGDSGSSVNVPLQGVTIHVEGNDALHTATDALGNFCLDPAPAGRFFVHIDGRTASNGVPPGTYYPSVGKAWESVPGQESSIGNVFLPLVPAGTLQPVSTTEDTPITFAPSVLAAFPEFAGVQVIVPADSLYADDGTRGGRVGIAPVPPDRIPGVLPPGLDFPIVLTVQTDGAANFDVPVPACFPNLPDPTTGKVLEPGEKSALWSFNHDTGEFEIVGPMTVTEDGRLVCTDPGVGIQAPGWHGAQPGSPSDVPPTEPEDPDDPEEPNEPEEPEDCDKLDALAKGASLVSSAVGLASEFGSVAKGVTCAIEVLNGAIQMANDLKNAAQNGSVSCVTLTFLSSQLNRIDGLISSCVPGIDVVSKLKNFCDKASSVLDALGDGGSLAACLSGNPVADQLSGWMDTINDYVGVAVNAKERLFGLANPKAQLRSLVADLLSKLSSIACTPPGAPVVLDPQTREDMERLAELLEKIAETEAPLDPETAELSRQVADLLDAQRAAANQFSPAELSTILQTSTNVKAKTDLVGRQIVRQLSKPVDRPVFAAITYDDIVLRRIVRGRSQQVLPPNTLVRIALYDPQSNGIAVEEAHSEESGRITKLGEFVLLSADGLPDGDGDGLVDDAELIVGTRPDAVDSDGDGINDFAEVRQGTNPLDGAIVQTGIVASADTPGTAVDVCAINDVAVVADSSSGISVFNAFNGMEPRIVAQVDTPGVAQAVSCGGNLIAVADGAAGLAVVDVTDPPAARILHQLELGGRARAVAVAGDIAFVGLGSGQIVSVDLPSGTILERVTVGAAIQDLALNGDVLYALTQGNLYALPVFNGPLQVAGSASSPGSIGAGGRRLRLFAGGSTAYATHTQGYNTFDLTNPTQPVLIAAGQTTQFGWKQIVANGSGLGVAAVDPNSTDDGAHDVSLYDVSDPTQTDAFLTRFETPGLAAAVSIYNGLAYVADSQSGLQVINYRPYDAAGVAPTITLSTNFGAGIAEEGKVMRVTAEVDDDVQVRNAEFFVDGVRVLTDGNFPFEHRFTTPLLSQQASFTLWACATDTGGNRTCTAESVVTLTEDATAPLITAVTPQNGAGVGQGTVSAVSAVFSEPIDSATLTGATFRLFAAGPDGVAGNADDVAVSGGAVTYREDINRAFLTFSQPLPPELYRAVVSGAVADLAGNPVGADFVWTFRIRGPLAWINPAGGRWSDPANWSHGVVPGPSDLAFITLSGDYTVVVDRNATVGSLTLGGASGDPTLWVTGNSTGGHVMLTVANDLESSGTLLLESQGSGWASELTVNGRFASTGVIVSGVGSGGSRTINANLTNLGALRINHSLSLSRTGGAHLNEGSIRIAAGQVLTIASGQVFRMISGELSGTGVLDLPGSSTFEFLAGDVLGSPPVLTNSTLSFGPQPTGTASFVVRGGGAKVTGNIGTGQTVWVRGDSVAGHTMLTSANSFTNAGKIRLESQGSGWQSALTVTNGTLTNTGTIDVSAGSGGTRTILANLDNRGTLNVNVSLSLPKSAGLSVNRGTLQVAANQTLSITGSGIFEQRDGSLTILGNFDLPGSNTFRFLGGTPTGNPPVLTSSLLEIGADSGPASFIVRGGNARLLGNVREGQTVWVRGDGVAGHTTLTSANGFTNAGKIRLESQSSGWQSTLTITSGTLTNSGTIDVNPGSGGTREILADLVNSGTLNVNASLSLPRAAGSYVNQGTLQVAAGQTLSITGSGIFEQRSGSLILHGNLDLPGANTFRFLGGTPSGNPPLLTNSTLELGPETGAATLIVRGGNAKLIGNIWPGQTVWVRGDGFAGHTTLTSATGFTNGGTLRLESQSSGWQSALAITSGTLTNTGTIAINVGTGGPRTILADLINRGAIQVNQSLSLPKSGGVYVNEGTLRIATGQTLSITGSGRLEQTAGSLIIDGNLDLPGSNTFRLLGGTLAGNPPLLTNSTLELGPETGAATVIVRGGSAKLIGSIWPGQTVWVRGDGFAGNTTLTSSTGFTNGGTLRLESQNSGWQSALAITSGTLTNTGTIDVNVGTGGPRTILADLINRGTIQVNQSLSLPKSGGVCVNEGTLRVAAGQTLSIIGSGRLEQAAGSLIIDGTLDLPGSNTFRFLGGTVEGNPPLLTNSTLELGAGAGSGSFIARGGSAKLAGDVGATQTVWVRGDGFVGNTTLTSTASFTNGGTLRLESQNSGWQSILAVGGTVTNTGTIDVNVGSGGPRQITGNLANQGSIAVEIGGTGATSQYVQLNVSGLVTLAGTLDITLINGFTPSLGQTFRVLSWGSRSGTFTTINGPGLGGGLRFEPSYGPTGLTLTVVAAP